MKKLIVRDKKGNILNTYNSVIEASEKEGIAIPTIYYKIRKGIKAQEKSNRDGKVWYFTENPGKKLRRREEVVLLDKDGNYIKTFKNQQEAGKYFGCDSTNINKILRVNSQRKCYYKDHYIMYETDYREKTSKEETIVEETPIEVSEIIKKKENMYYINVLVGLANGELVDGATYEVNGNKTTYREEQQALMIGDIIYLSRQSLFNEVEVEYPLLNTEERKFLNNLLKAFSKVDGIIKCESNVKGFNYIRIETGTGDDIVLPDFKDDKYYKNLEKNRLYTIEELDIEKK